MSLFASVRDLLEDQEGDDGREDSGCCCLAIDGNISDPIGTAKQFVFEHGWLG